MTVDPCLEMKRLQDQQVDLVEALNVPADDCRKLEARMDKLENT